MKFFHSLLFFMLFSAACHTQGLDSLSLNLNTLTTSFGDLNKFLSGEILKKKKELSSEQKLELVKLEDVLRRQTLKLSQEPDAKKKQLINNRIKELEKQIQDLQQA